MERRTCVLRSPLPRGKRTPTPAQRAASRANGQRSRGPVTDAGKARSSLNALRHGLFAKAISPIQDARGYDELFHAARAALVEQFGPITFTEQVAVDELAHDYVRLADARKLVEAVQQPPPGLAREGADAPEDAARVRAVEEAVALLDARLPAWTSGAALACAGDETHALATAAADQIARVRALLDEAESDHREEEQEAARELDPERDLHTGRPDFERAMRATEERVRGYEDEARDGAEETDLAEQYARQVVAARGESAASAKSARSDAAKAAHAEALAAKLRGLESRYAELKVELGTRQAQRREREREERELAKDRERIARVERRRELSEEVREWRAAWAALTSGRITDQVYIAAVLAGTQAPDDGDRGRLLGLLGEWRDVKRAWLRGQREKARKLEYQLFDHLRVRARRIDEATKLERYVRVIARSVERKLETLYASCAAR